MEIASVFTQESQPAYALSLAQVQMAAYSPETITLSKPLPQANTTESWVISVHHFSEDYPVGRYWKYAPKHMPVPKSQLTNEDLPCAIFAMDKRDIQTKAEVKVLSFWTMHRPTNIQSPGARGSKGRLWPFSRRKQHTSVTFPVFANFCYQLAVVVDVGAVGNQDLWVTMDQAHGIAQDDDLSPSKGPKYFGRVAKIATAHNQAGIFFPTSPTAATNSAIMGLSTAQVKGANNNLDFLSTRRDS